MRRPAAGGPMSVGKLTVIRNFHEISTDLATAGQPATENGISGRVPHTFDDDYVNRARAAAKALMRIAGGKGTEKLQAPLCPFRRGVHIQGPRRVEAIQVAAARPLDRQNVGRLLDYLDELGLRILRNPDAEMLRIGDTPMHPLTIKKQPI